MKNTAARADAARPVVWVSLLLLLGVQLADIYQQGMPAIIALGKLLPLLVFVPGMYRDNLRSYIWLCFVSLLYFISLVTRLFADPDSLRAIIGMVAVVVLFVSAMLYVRWRGKSLKAESET